MRWWHWIGAALALFVGGIAVGALSFWLADTTGPASGATFLTFGLSLFLSYAAAPACALKGVFELVRQGHG